MRLIAATAVLACITTALTAQKLDRAGIVNYTKVDATKSLWATFLFARQGRPRRHLTTRWYPPDGHPPSDRYPVNKDVIPVRRGFSYWRDPDGLAEGRWRCALLAGDRGVDAGSIRGG